MGYLSFRAASFFASVLLWGASLSNAQAPSVSASLGGQTVGLGTVTESVQFANNGTGTAQNLTITSVSARVLGGTGTVALQSPVLPSLVGTISAGGSQSASLTLSVPSTVMRFSLVENGTVNDSSGNSYQFSLSQLVVVARPSVTVSPSSLTFATQQVGSTSAAQPVTISAGGTAALTIASIAPSGDFGIGSNTCPLAPATLTAGSSCTVNVTFSPTAAGTRSGSLTVTDNATGSPQTVSLTGTGQVSSTSLSVSPTSLTFATQNTGTTSAAQTVTVTATGNQNVNLTSVVASGDFAITANTCSTSLAAGASCSFGVTFSPTAGGTRTGAITIIDNATGSPQTVSLTGTGQVSSTSLSVSPTSLTFATQNTGSTSTAQTVTLTATGNQAVNLTSVVASGDFAIKSNTCSTSLAAGASCSFGVMFSPTAAGTRTGAITITDNATGSPQTVSLTGTGQVPSTSLSVSPTSLTFATQNTGSTSAAQTVTLTATGNQAVNLASVVASGDFAITANTCSTFLAAGASCSFGVTFSPTAGGTRTGAITITDNATGSPQTVSLSGTGQVPATSISLSPSVLTFAIQNTGTTSAAQTVIVTATGNQTVNLTSIVASGDFAITANTCSTSLAAGVSCSFGVTFSPTAGGTRTGAITITDNATGSPQTVSLTGTGQVPSTSLSVSPTSLTFATQNTGSTSAAQTVTLTATGNQTVSLTSVVASGDFAITANTCSTSLTAGASCSFGVTFSPTAGGTRTGAITITDNATGSPQTVSLTGTGQVPSTSLSVSPTSLTFATQNTGSTSAAQTITLTATGNQAVNLTSIVASGDFAVTANTCSSSLTSGASCSFGVTFSPTAGGTRTGAITITDNATGSPQTVSLSGTGQVPATSISLSPSVLTFAIQNTGTTSAAQTVIVTATGNQTVNLTSIVASGDFAITANTCSTSLAAGASCSFGVTFSPTAAGTRTGAITITDNATGSPQTVSLTGTAQVPSTSLSVSPTSLTFATQNTGSTSAAQTVTLTATGNQTVSLTSVVASGDFAITANTCSTSLAVGASCSFGVTFSPTAAGTRTGAITITDNATGSPQTVSLTGTGQVPSTSLSVSPTSLTFATQNTGSTSAAQTVTLTATGNQAVNLTSIVASGDFAITSNTCSSSLTAGASCSFGVTFSPTAGGTRTGAITITDNATGSPQTVSLTGTGQVPSTSLSVSPTSLTFSAQNIGTTSAAQGVSVTASGNQPVTISSITASGDFAISSSTCPISPSTLAAGSSCSFNVAFTPTAAGTRTGSVTVTGNASNSPQSVALSGTGQTVTTTITFSPTSVTFSAQNVNSTSASQSVSVNNTGTTAANFSGVVISGTNASDFAIASNSCGSSVAVGNSCSVAVTFTPTAAGTRTASLVFTDNASGSPQSLSLTGTGQSVTTTLSITPASLTFAAQNLNTASSSQYVAVQNTGTTPVSVSSVALSGSNATDYSIASNNCGTSIAIGNTCYVYISFTPSAVGTRTASLVFTDNATGSPQSVGISGTGQSATSVLSVTPATLTFNPQNIGTPSGSQYITVTNNGTTSVTFSSPSIGGTNASDFSIASNTCGASLAASGACNIYVIFTPGATGARTATLTLTDSAPSSPQTVTLSGTGQVGTTLSFSPASLIFPAGNEGVSQSESITITNTGTVAASFTSFTIGGTNATDFVITSNNCPTGSSTLAAGGSCTVTITLTPSGGGSRVANLSVADNGNGSPQVIFLGGNGASLNSTLAFEYLVLPFDNVNIGSTSSAQYTYVYNVGNTTVSLSSIAVTGANAGDFSITQNQCATSGNSLSVGSNCYVYVSFTPSAAGPRFANLTYTDTANGSPQSILLTGNGVTPGAAAYLISNNLQSETVNVGATSSLGYVYIYNSGNVSLNISSIALTGANASDFSVSQNECSSSYSNTLKPSQECYVYVSFTPSAAGVRTASLNFADNAASSPQSVTVTGTGQTATQILTANPLQYAFGATYEGTTASQQYVYIQNSGAATVTLSSFTLTGANAADFTISQNECASSYPSGLTAGSQCYVYLTFTPGGTGTRTAALTVANSSSSTLNIPVTGLGVASGLSYVVFPSTLTFSQATDGTSPAQTVTISNTGSEALTLSSIAITGSSAFAISSNGCPAASSTLASGSSCTVQVTFAPTAAGTATASLGIASPAGNQAAALSGSAASPSQTISVSTASVTFNTQSVGVSSLAQAILIQNTGNEPVTFTSFTLGGANASDFTVNSNSCPASSASLAVGASCILGVTFTPAVAGSRGATLTITDSAAGSPQSVSLNGTGAAGSYFNVTPGAIDFETSVVGVSTASSLIAIRNTSSSPITFTSYTFAGTNPSDFIIVNNTCAASYSNVLAATNICYLYVQFTPAAAGVRTATLQLNSNAVGSPQTVSLTGIGTVSAPTLSMARSLDFAVTTQGGSTTANLSVANIGNVPVTFTSYTIGGTNAADFAVATNSCATSYSNVLGVGGSCGLSITFSPTAAGLRTATLQFADNATGSPQTVILEGAAQASTASLSLRPVVLDFSAINVGSTTNPQYAYAYNIGTTSVAFSAYTISGANPGDFAISNNYCSSSYANSLTAGSYCYIGITFTPTAAGVRAATLTFTDNATGGSQTVALSGTGQAATRQLTVTPTTVDFNVTNVGSTASAQAIYPINTGTSTVTFTGYALSGTNSGDFAISYNSCLASDANALTAGSYCQVNITFTPTGTGVRSATLTFSDNATGGSQTVSLAGIGQAATQSLSVTPSALAFTATPGTAAGVKYVYFTNTGTSPITFTAGSIGGANAGDFTISNNYCVSSFATSGLSAGTDCYVGINFTPSAAGTETATLSVTNSSSATPASISLVGQGETLQKSLRLSSDYLFYVPERVGTPIQTYVYLYNVSNAPVTPTSFTITGANASDFTITGSTSCAANTAITSGGQCYVYVQFNPTAGGLRTATLNIADDASGSVSAVALIGSGYVSGATITTSSANFQSTPLNTATNPTSYYVYFYNQASTAISISAPVIVGPNAGDFTVTSTSCGTSIAASSNCYAYVQFRPTVAGPRYAAVEVTYTSGTGSLADAPIAGDGNGGSGVIANDPTALEFSTTNVGVTAAYQVITLTNIGQGTVNLSGFAFTGTNAADFSLYLNSCASALAPGGSCNVYVQFIPSAAGLRTGALQITDDASNTPQIVSLVGVGQSPAESLYPNSTALDFGSVDADGSTSTSSLSLYSEGTANINLSNLQITGANAADFTFYTNSCGTQLSGSCSLTIQFAPSAPGERTANLVVTSDAPGSPLTIPLTGLGLTDAEVVELSSVNYDFGIVGVNGQNSTYITVTNRGNTPIHFTSPSIAGTNSGDFLVTSSTCGTLAVNGNCYVYIAFTPSVTGTRSATLQINDDATGSPQTVNLTGVGQVITKLLSANTTAVDFDVQPIGVATSPVYVTITSSGSGTVNLSGVAIGGTNAADYQITSETCGSTLTTGSTCYVYLSFTPSVVGPELATLTLSSDSSAGPLVITLAGEGETATQQLTARISALDLGTSPVGAASASQYFYINNTGTTPVQFLPVTITGPNAANFSVSSNNCTGKLAPGGNSTCYMYVTFTPSAAGPATATLNVNSTAAGSPLTIALSGTGTALSGAVLNFQNPIAFPATTVNTTSSGIYEYVFNVGTSSATFTSVALGGTNAGDFIIYSNGCTSSLSANSYCAVILQFKPTATGARTAALTFTDSAAASPQIVTLTGTGQ